MGIGPASRWILPHSDIGPFGLFTVNLLQPERNLKNWKPFKVSTLSNDNMQVTRFEYRSCAFLYHLIFYDFIFRAFSFDHP